MPRARPLSCGPTAGTVTDVPDADAAAALGTDVVLLATAGDRIPDVEVVAGAPEPAGAGLLDVVAVMDRLRSPGGCPWDAEQTHSSLRGYLLEEAHEAYDAIVDDDPTAMREELGDVLLQVVFHARVAAEAAGRAPVRHRRRRRATWSTSSSAGTRTCSGTPGPATSRRSRRAGRRSSRPRSSAARRPRASPARSRRPPGVPRWSGGPAAPGCRPPSPPTSPWTARRRSASGCSRWSPPATERGWDVEDALREAVRRYAGELDAEAADRARS